MFEKYMIFPMTPDGDLYALHDTEGRQVAMGSREVCRTLLYLVTTSPLLGRPPRRAEGTTPGAAVPPRSGKRAERG
jgi:hypothetical protein